MNTDAEAQGWHQTCSHDPGELAKMLQDALGCFSRRPGLDDLTRLSPVTLTNLGFELLSEALEQQPRQAWHVLRSDHIELRWQLRMHLKRRLQERLVHDGLATSSVRDNYFADDLGL